jgi:phosphate-selective porin OprO/OprP
MSDGIHLGNVELAGVFGPVHTAAEYIMAEVDGRGGPDADYSGYYFQVGWFLTGESRPYNQSTGSWDRLKPRNRFSKASGKGSKKGGGLGAMEVAFRYSNLDLNDPSPLLPGGGYGGEEDNLSLAFNWYLAPNLRFGVNLLKGEVDMGPTDADFTAAGVRLQADW